MRTRTVFFILVLLTSPLFSQAATCTSKTTGGNWNAATTWLLGCGATGPVAGDNVVIATTGANAVTVTASAIAGSVSIKTGSILRLGGGNLAVSTFSAGSGNMDVAGIFTLDPAIPFGYVLSVAGTLYVAPSGVMNLSLSANVDCDPTFTGNATNDGTINTGPSFNTTQFKRDLVNNGVYDGGNNSGGAFSVSGNLVNTGTFIAKSGPSSVAGNFSNSGAFTATAGSFAFNGTTGQTISGPTSFNNMTVNNSSATVQLLSDVTVKATLSLSGFGRIQTDASVLTVASGNAVTGAGGTRFVEGNLSKPFSIANPTRTFELGTSAPVVTYSPVAITATSITATGNLIVTATAGSHPNLGLSGLDNATPKKLNRYWSVANSTTSPLRFASYSPTFTFVATDVDPAADPLSFIATRYSPPTPLVGTWNATSNGASAATSLQVLAETGFGDFAIGEPVGYDHSLARFNAYDPAPLTPAGSVHGRIRTKISGAPFDLTVVHLNGPGTSLATITDAAVTVSLYDGTVSSGSFSDNCWSGWTPIPGAVRTIAFPGTSTQVATFSVPNSYRNVRVRISNTGGSQVGCSGDLFAIRPSGFTLSAADGTSSTAGRARSLSNSSAAGGVVHRAGTQANPSPFTLYAAAQPASATNYDGTLAIKSGSVMCDTSMLAGCVTGVLTLGSFTALGGVVTSNSVNYSEAGGFSVELTDQTYASVDLADSTAAQRTVSQTAAPLQVGRFVPDHFTVTFNNVPKYKTFNATDSECNGTPARSFTYIGQPFQWSTAPLATITAKNAADAVTLNYSGTLAHLAAATTISWDCTTAPSNCTVTSANPGKGMLVQTIGAATIPASPVSWDSGLASFAAPLILPFSAGAAGVVFSSSDTLAFKRNLTTPQAPFSAKISIVMQAYDNSESAVSGNGLLATSTPAAIGNVGFDSGNEFRYGQMKFSNSYGSELLNLRIPLKIQYWNGVLFAQNVADNCTTIRSSSSIGFGNYSGAINVTNMASPGHVSLAGPVIGGQGYIVLTKPSPTPAGSGGLTMTANLPADGKKYLQGLNGAIYDLNPSGHASFGFHRGGPIIYMREMY
jgi:hypothetical protein